MNMLSRIMTAIFGETLPPASSDGDDSTWEQRSHNKTLRRQMPTSKAEAIKAADKESKERYDHMDANISRLRQMASDSRRRKERLRARREARREAAKATP